MSRLFVLFISRFLFYSQYFYLLKLLDILIFNDYLININKYIKHMRKILILLLIVIALPASAQFDLKGGIVYADKELTNFAVTGQFYKDYLAVSGDVFIPTQKSQKVSGAGRIGLNLGSYRCRIVGDIGVMYEDDIWRCAGGVEVNIRLFGPVSMYGRWQRSFPITTDDEHTCIRWCQGRSDFSVGIAINLAYRRCY